MNNKLILEALKHLLVSLDVNDPKVESTILDIHEVLNPKEDLPYEDSLNPPLKGFAKMAMRKEAIASVELDRGETQTFSEADKFAKSSKGEENDKR